MKTTLMKSSFALLGLLALPFLSSDVPEAEEAKDSAAIDQALAKTLLDSAAIARYRFKFDAGDDPVSAQTWGQGPNNQSERAASGKTLDMPCYLLSNGELLTPDTLTPPRFIKSVEVEKDGVRLPAEIVGANLDKGALFLKTNGSLGATPLKFSDDASAKAVKAVNYWPDGALWRVAVRKLSPEYVEYPGSQEKLLRGPSQSLLCSADGKPLGFMMREDDLDGEWRGDPAKWPKDSPQSLAAMTEKAKAKVLSSLYLVKLGFKLPPQNAGSPLAFQPNRQNVPGSPDGGTEIFALGLPLDSKRLLALTDAAPDKLACLETVRILPANGDPSGEIEGSCSAWLRDFPALIIEAKDPAAKFAVPELSKASPQEMKGKSALFLQVELYPEKLEAEAFAIRSGALDKGYRNLLSYRQPLQLGGSYDKVRSARLLSDLQGRLAALQLDARRKPRFESYYQSNLQGGALLPLREIEAVASDKTKLCAFVQTPEELRRDPWFGAEVQKMSLDLARANKASQATRNGRFGGIVSSVTPDSPAGKAGLKQGDILLRILFEGDEAPLDLEFQDFNANLGMDYPWGQLDSLPENMLQRIPPPWSAAPNPFNKFLAQAGQGRKYSLDVIRDGKEATLGGLSVELGPEDYSTAAKFALKDIGLTVKSLTYDARRYLKLPPDAPGVVISKLESGSKASTAGLKPYEVITSVNGQPVASVKEFEKLCAGQAELKFIVLRLAAERSVRINGRQEP